MSRTQRFLAAVSAIIIADQLTKMIAVDRLSPAYVPHAVFGEGFRLTLVYNRGAAFGIHVGEWSRVFFTTLTVVAVVLLWRMFRASAPEARVKVTSLAMVMGGALGNLVDRLRSSRGVVDFLDVGVGAWRWPTFNLADIAVSCGAAILAVVLWREEEHRVSAERAAKAAARVDAAGSAAAR